ncbi:MAG: ribose 5-phosphate isomerase B, partial [Candidatus Rokubacteria bacterium]|nr:ribose 5-phosphate isomerase B [Candidatus Rokubacteria bacterium]
MRVAFGCDHAGHPLKEPIIAALEQDGHHVLDLGTFSSDPVDYPDFARAVGNAVRNQFVELGILVCGSGVGAAIAANKLRGVRAALCQDLFTARQSREDDNANVLCLGARALDPEAAIEIAREWLSAEFSGEERHIRRLAKITELEQGFLPRATERTVRREPTPRPARIGEEPEPPRARPTPRPAPLEEEPAPRPVPRAAKERPAPTAPPPAREPARAESSLSNEVAKVIEEFDRLPPRTPTATPQPPPPSPPPP